MTDHRSTVLIIDDQRSNILVLTEILKNHYRVLFAKEGYRGLEMAQGPDAPDLILLDVMMPEIDGYEVCQRLKAHEVSKDIPVIFITAMSSETDEELGFQVGAVDYILKPFSESAVVSRVKTHIELKKHKDSLEQLVAERTESLNRTMEELAQSNQVKQNFIDTISHELRTPMNAIFGGLQLAQHESREGFDPPMGMIQSGAEQMMTIVNDILKYTEIQANRSKLIYQSVDMQEFWRTLSTRYRRLSQEKKIGLDWQVADELTGWLRIDEDKFYTIFAKVMDNALKFTKAGQVSFHAESIQLNGKTQMKAVISDTGIGIEDSDLKIVFESFKQKEVGLRRSYGGLGIGLSICRELTEMLGGTITISSEIGRGTKLELILPVEKAESPTQIQQQAKGGLPILVVEDNRVNLQVLIKMLSRLGFSSLIAENGAEALDIP